MTHLIIYSNPIEVSKLKLNYQNFVKMTTKLVLAIAVVTFAVANVVAKEDVIDQVIVATSNCNECGMTFFGTISIKVSGRRLMTSQIMHTF